MQTGQIYQDEQGIYVVKKLDSNLAHVQYLDGTKARVSIARAFRIAQEMGDPLDKLYEALKPQYGLSIRCHPTAVVDVQDRYLQATGMQVEEGHGGIITGEYYFKNSHGIDLYFPNKVSAAAVSCGLRVTHRLCSWDQFSHKEVGWALIHKGLRISHKGVE